MEKNEIDGYITPDRLWAAIPFGKKYMIIHNGKQISVCNKLESAKKFIQKNSKKTK